MAKGVTPQSSDYSKWYTDVITKAELADYGPVKGTMVIRPYGYSIWESVKSEFDKEFKDSGHVNAYFPLFIPKSFLAKEAEHIEGFAKECAVVTHSRLKVDENNNLVTDPDSKLEEEIIVRPTSETVIWSMYKKWINSYRDLPILINQWANVVRWEMRTRLFLRTSEFLWQEGHTAHASETEAQDEAIKMLNIYQKVVEDTMAVPVLTGYKSDSEKFAGAIDTYCIEAMMGDKKALQAGTSHYLGQNFAKAFDVKFQNEDNKEEYVYATSWGVSTRLIGALIMVHGDDKGLRLPPKVAPIQIVIVPIFKSDEDKKTIIDYIKPVMDKLEELGVRILFDDRNKMSPGFKFNEWEMKGVPIRIEVGLRDIENNVIIYSRRDQDGKNQLPITDSANYLNTTLQDIQTSLFNQAKQFQDNNTHIVNTYSEFKSIIHDGGFAVCGWDGTNITEEKIKKETKATIRCIPFEQNIDNLKCIYSNNQAKYKVVFSKAY
tara:strand:+ start:400 stop:1869 length:1470 start_codon:yes stop_codon:yes gene_type:complete